MTESATELLVSGRTGETCRQAGPYRSDGETPLVVFFRLGDTFPVDTEGRETHWTLLREE